MAFTFGQSAAKPAGGFGFGAPAVQPPASGATPAFGSGAPATGTAFGQPTTGIGAAAGQQQAAQPLEQIPATTVVRDAPEGMLAKIKETNGWTKQCVECRARIGEQQETLHLEAREVSDELGRLRVFLAEQNVLQTQFGLQARRALLNHDMLRRCAACLQGQQRAPAGEIQEGFIRQFFSEMTHTAEATLEQVRPQTVQQSLQKQVDSIARLEALL